MAGMTDIGLVNILLGNLLRTTATVTWSAGSQGGTNLTILPPLHLHMMTLAGQGTETTAGTEITSVNSPGYTQGYPAGGLTMGSPAFNALSSGATANTNQVQWTSSGTWTAGVGGIEIWDDSGTAVRILYGNLTATIAVNTVVSGDTVTFAAGAITVSGATW